VSIVTVVLHVSGAVGILLDDRRELGSRPRGKAVSRMHGNTIISAVSFTVGLGFLSSRLVGRKGKNEPGCVVFHVLEWN